MNMITPTVGNHVSLCVPVNTVWLTPVSLVKPNNDRLLNLTGYGSERMGVVIHGNNGQNPPGGQGDHRCAPVIHGYVHDDRVYWDPLCLTQMSHRHRRL